MSSADNLGKQFGIRSGPNVGPHSDLDPNSLILIVFLEEFIEKVNLKKKNSRQQQKHENLPSMQRVNQVMSSSLFHFSFVYPW